MKSNKFLFIILIIQLLVSCYLYWGKMSLAPMGRHTWAQTDYYAVAKNFRDFDADFFKPETYVLNLQWTSPKLNPEDRKGITRLDMPIMSYLAYKLNEVTGEKISTCFRVLTYSFSFISIFYLVLFFWKRTRNKLLCLSILFFCYSSPLLAYYQVTFIPSIPALSLSIVGVLIFFDFYKSKKQIYLISSTILMTIGALIRFPHIIPLIAVVVFFIVDMVLLKNKERIIFTFSIPIMGICVIFSYFFYNGYLENTYGSMFLSSPQPVSTIEELSIVMSSIVTYFYERFYSISQLFLILLCTVFFVYKCKALLKSEGGYHFVYLIVLLLGGGSYYLLMSHHIVAHDYYIFDSLYLPILLFSLFMIEYTLKNVRMKYNYIVVLFFLSIQIFELSNIKECIHNFFVGSENSSRGITCQNFFISSSFIKSCKLPKSAKVLVNHYDGPNVPLAIVERKGFVIWSRKEEEIEKTFSEDFDYAIFQNQFLMNELFPNYPEMMRKLRFVATNGILTVYKKGKSKSKTYDDVLGLHPSGLKFNYDDSIPPYSDISSLWIGKGKAYNLLVRFKTNLEAANEQSLKFVMTSENKVLGKTYYRSWNANKNYDFKVGGWQDVEILLTVPSISFDDRINFYFKDSKNTDSNTIKSLEIESLTEREVGMINSVDIHPMILLDQGKIKGFNIRDLHQAVTIFNSSRVRNGLRISGVDDGNSYYVSYEPSISRKEKVLISDASYFSFSYKDFSRSGDFVLRVNCDVDQGIESKVMIEHYTKRGGLDKYSIEKLPILNKKASIYFLLDNVNESSKFYIYNKNMKEGTKMSYSIIPVE